MKIKSIGWMLSVLWAVWITHADAISFHKVEFSSGIQHAGWNELLETYVNDQGKVAYEDWLQNGKDLVKLEDYLQQFESSPTVPAMEDERAASLINLYNALVIQLILKNYPIDSIQMIDEPFSRRVHFIGGRKVSLQDIQDKALRPLLGYRVHAVLVNGAVSSPPLQRFAFYPEELDSQIKSAFRDWLGRQDLNRIESDNKRLWLSNIFVWFREDFEKAGGALAIITPFLPPSARRILRDRGCEINYIPFDWRLNDQQWIPREFSRSKMIRENIARYFRR